QKDNVAIEGYHSHTVVRGFREIQRSITTQSETGRVADLCQYAGPSEPRSPGIPVPAIVEILPVESMRRTRFESRKNRLPELSVTIPFGRATDASAAGPPSPLTAEIPLPATDRTIPFV